MKKLFTLLTILFITATFAQQAPIMRCNPAGTSCTPYNTLPEAYAAANAGDYIYLPGGNSNGDIIIDKTIHIIGAGFHSGGSATTGVTNVSGNINLTTGADGSSFEGFFLAGNFQPQANLSNITIQKVNFNLLEGGVEWNYCTIINCVARRYVYMGNGFTSQGTNNVITNSIINSFHSIKNSTITNCIIGRHIDDPYNNYCFNNVRNTTIQNCVIESYAWIDSNSNCDGIFFNHNITGVGGLTNGNPNAQELYNTYNMTPAQIFVNAGSFHDYSEANNYHILGGSNVIGIYGGSIPWVDGVIPSNPHIYFKNIGNSTDANGNLPVVIKVSSHN
jgi:hypothetical protein